jgi:hypothetical protein
VISLVIPEFFVRCITPIFSTQLAWTWFPQGVMAIGFFNLNGLWVSFHCWIFAIFISNRTPFFQSDCWGHPRHCNPRRCCGFCLAGYWGNVR